MRKPNLERDRRLCKERTKRKLGRRGIGRRERRKSLMTMLAIRRAQEKERASRPKDKYALSSSPKGFVGVRRSRRPQGR